MIISSEGSNKFKIKCKEGTIFVGDNIKINDFEISGPGEYEIGGISVERIDDISIICSEDMTLVYLNSNKPLKDKELEKVEETDILFMPFGEIVDLKVSMELSNQIEPKVLIPTRYKSIEDMKKIKDIVPEIIKEYKISKNLLPEERKIIVINE